MIVVYDDGDIGSGFVDPFARRFVASKKRFPVRVISLAIVDSSTDRWYV